MFVPIYRRTVYQFFFWSRQALARQLHHTTSVYRPFQKGPSDGTEDPTIKACNSARHRIFEVGNRVRDMRPVFHQMQDATDRAADVIEDIGRAVGDLGPDLARIHNEHIPNIQEARAVASQAQMDANEAKINAKNARKLALHAEQSAANATQDATTASARASDALSSANESNGIANSAKQSANQAIVTARAVSQKANEAINASAAASAQAHQTKGKVGEIEDHLKSAWYLAAALTLFILYVLYFERNQLNNALARLAIHFNDMAYNEMKDDILNELLKDEALFSLDSKRQGLEKNVTKLEAQVLSLSAKLSSAKHVTKPMSDVWYAMTRVNDEIVRLLALYNQTYSGWYLMSLFSNGYAYQLKIHALLALKTDLQKLADEGRELVSRSDLAPSTLFELETAYSDTATEDDLSLSFKSALSVSMGAPLFES